MTNQELTTLLSETAVLTAENAKQISEIGRKLDKLSVSVGEIGNKFGRFTEGLFNPSLERILREDFQMEETFFRAKSRKGGENLELDALGIINGGRNEAVIVEVKSRLREPDLDDFIETLAEFGRFFPEHADKKLYGLIAAVDISGEIQKKAEKLGFGVVKISDETFRLQSKLKSELKNFGSAKASN